MPNILTDIQLWDAERTGQITLPERLYNSIASGPSVTRRLGGVDEMTMTVYAGCKFAVSTDDDYQLSQGKIIRFVYDDSSIQEWRIKTGAREFSGKQDFQITAEPIEQDLKTYTVRKTLTNGHVRASVSFYNNNFSYIAGQILSTDYNCSDLFTLGIVASGLDNSLYNLVLNASSIMDGLKELSRLAEAEWDVTYNSGNDNYEINFYEAGKLGGGEAEAADRPIAMGGGEGNRLTLERRDETEEYFSRVVPLMGEGSEIQTVAGARWRVDSYSSPTITLKENAIAKDGYGLTSGLATYFGNESEGWHEVTATTVPNQVTVSGDASGLSHGYFREGAAKNEVILLEDADALDKVGLKEEKFQRPDIPPYSNLIEDAGITPTLSDWSGNLPVGFQKINGAETVSQATGDVFVKHGTISAKVSCNQDEGLQTDSITLEPEDLSPYFSMTVYLQVEQGSVRVELIDGSGEKFPKDKLAETNVKETRAIKIGGTEPDAGPAQIKIIAQSDNTVFYLDAITLTQSSYALEYAPLMGPKALWIEAGKYLKKYGGDRPDVWQGEVMDEAYFGTAKEIEIGSFVKVQEDWNEDTGTYDTEFVVRVVEVSYQEDRLNGRYRKTVRLADKNSEAARVFQEQYLTVGSQQSSLQVREVPEKPVIDIDNAVVEGGTPRFEQVEVYPGTGKPPLVLGSNAQGQLVAGLNADQLDGYDASSFIRDLTGTINQVQVTGQPDGSTNLSTPQDLHEDAEMILKSLLLKEGLTLDEIAGYIRTQDFNHPGFAGTGFDLQKDSNGNWTLVTDNIVIRNQAKIFEILVQQLRATSQFLLTEGHRIEEVEENDSAWDVIASESDIVASESDLRWQRNWRMFIPEDTRLLWDDWDLIKRQEFSGRNIGVTEATVVDLEEGSATVTDNTPRRWVDVVIEDGSDIPGEAMNFARLGNYYNTDRQGGILLAGSGEDAPYTMMYDGVDRFPKFGTSETIITYRGNLEGKSFPEFPDLDGTQGHLYADVIRNAYISGEINVTGGNAATKAYVDDQAGGNVTIRASSAPTDRPGGEALESGDTWINTLSNDRIFTYDGSQWEATETVIDGSRISITLDQVADGGNYQRAAESALDGNGLVILSAVSGNLDDISDGNSYQRSAAGALNSGGYPLLDQAIGNLDDIGDGSNYARVDAAQLNASGLVLLSGTVGNLGDIADGGGYAKVDSASLTSGGLVIMSRISGNLDDIADGGSYAKVLKTEVSAGHIVIEGPNGNTVIDQGVIDTNALFANTANITDILTIGAGGELLIQDPTTDDKLSISRDGVALTYDANGGTGLAEFSWFDSAVGDLTGHIYAYQDKNPTPSVNTLVLRAPTNGGTNDSLVHLTAQRVQINAETSFQNRPLFDIGITQYNHDTVNIGTGERTLNVNAPVMEITGAAASTRIVAISLSGSMTATPGMKITVLNSASGGVNFGWRDQNQTSAAGANIRANNNANYDHRNNTAMTLTLGSDGWYVSNDHGA